ncbi:MAG: DUF1338 domain-containing protein [Bacteroidales bacterium]|nr:DUF1338 domain-containing protein [Bacteroidales bacterium]
MKYSNDTTLHLILNSLFEVYQENVTDVRKITRALINRGIISSQSDIVNDHIAFRTLGVDHLGIKSLEKIFLAQGYTRMEAYRFEAKKLNAFWYAPPSPVYPRIFISELRVEELSGDSQNIIRNYTAPIQHDPVDSLDLSDGESLAGFLHSPLWETPTLGEYQTLLNESEYAAWVIYNRYYLNHYTISVHMLPEAFNTLDRFNRFLEEIGIILNTAGGKIKTSQDGLLLQSSSVSALKEAVFGCGSISKIPGSYVEFAERRVLPQFEHLPKNEIRPQHRREGFEAQNADKIFESTYRKQTLK